MYTIDKHKNIKKANIKQNRFLIIAKLREAIFQIDDLARIWGINNRHTLLITLKRYTDTGLIYRLYRGLYSLNKAANLDPLLLGAKAINSYCYVGGETVLAKHGVIFQNVNYFTFTGSQTKRFQIADYKYYCRQLKDDFLYNDTGIDKSGEFNIASLERAVADLLYFNAHYHFDNPAAIDFGEVKKIQRAVYNI